MLPVLEVALLWALFAGTHILLATSPIRGALVARLGERGFTLLFLAVASVTFAALVYGYAAVRFEGPPGPALASSPARPVLLAAIVAGLSLMIGAFAPRGYWTSPAMILTTGVREPYGLERVTRHPFFAGVVLFATAHALLAPHLVSTVFFLGYVVLSIGGAAHQGRKLLDARGPAYAGYLSRTSAIPFRAILQGRQRFVASEIPWLFLGLGALLAVPLRSVHAAIFDHGGVYFSGAVIGASIAIGVVAFRRQPAPTG